MPRYPDCLDRQSAMVMICYFKFEFVIGASAYKENLDAILKIVSDAVLDFSDGSRPDSNQINEQSF